MNKTTSHTALLLEGIHPKAKIALQNSGLKVKELNQAPNAEGLIKELKDISILGSRSQTQITKEILAKSDLLCIGAFCIGVNQIDLKTACEKAISVFNAPYSNTRSVAEMIIGFIISLSRNRFDASQTEIHEGHWRKSAKGSFEVRGKTLGIIGYGHIGSQVSVLAESLGMNVLYYDIVAKMPIGNAQPTLDKKSLLRESDFVTLHVPETPETINLIGKKELQLMKKGARLINTSRGTVVSISDLKESLDSNKLSGAALDVFPAEPKNNKELFKSPLQNTKKVILTPHIGGSTEEAQESIAKEVSDNLKNFILLGSTENSVNFPQLHLPSIPEKTQRISNVHKNQPGVLSQINNFVSQSGANIKNQYLSTNEAIGYLVMDIEKGNIQDLYDRMSQLDASLRTRVFF